MAALRAVSDSGLERDLVEIQGAFDTWARDGRLVIPGCLQGQLDGAASLTPKLWLAALCRHRDQIGWEQVRRRTMLVPRPA